MDERKGLVTFKGNPLTLLGPELKPEAKAPDFRVIDINLNETGLKDFKGMTKLISVTPSLDTSVCNTQARTFNKEAANLSKDIVVMNISMDLPFAISRFCETAGIDRVKTFSDHRHASFGVSYGVLIKELRLLARSVFIIDKNDYVKYVELVPEITKSVDFSRALDAAGKVVKGQPIAA